MTTAFDAWESHFSNETRATIASFHRPLTREENQSSSHTVKNKELKRKFAGCCVKVIDQASRENKPIQAVVSLLRGFPFYTFGDSLDEAFALLHELDMGIEPLREGTPEQQMRTIRQMLVANGDDSSSLV